jgi:hypothetical protein
MNIGHSAQVGLSFSRKLVFGLSGVLFFLIIAGLASSKMLLAGLIIALFLGVTNFGCQCPLLLSLRSHINRMKTKDKISNIKE